MKNTIKIAFLAAFAVCATAYMTLVTIVIFPGNHVIRPVAAMAQNESEIEAVIVLGHSVNRENEPSQWLVGRLEVALELYNLGI
ncbi:MAG: hypothetical protein FWD01_05570, partial [Defluviitaleaceae bacterium]|nr:hypothetical protein [Defluviitaleaceae bacterium]